MEYLTESLANRTTDARLFKAYQRNDLSIVSNGFQWWTEATTISKSAYKSLCKEMARLYPHLIHPLPPIKKAAH